MRDQENIPRDHGVIVSRKRMRISWVWLFPVLAMLAAGTMFYRNVSNEGPTIYVQFSSAPGIKPEKTLLYYRGVEAGTVTGIQLGKNLDNVLVSVRLRKHAEELAREGTLFWIDQPVFNLAKPSGIQSLIEGNSLQARMGSGERAYFFIGSDEVPIAPLEGEPLFVRLTSQSIPAVETGAEVIYRGLPVGLVRKKGLDDKGNPYLEVGFAKRYVDLIRSTSRFWVIPPLSVKIGSGILQLDMPSLKNFVLGAIAVDNFGDRQGAPAQAGALLALYESEEAASATSEPITLEFKNGQGLSPGLTQLRYLGVPVGIVEKVDASAGKVVVTAHLRPGFEILRRKGSSFSIMRPVLELQKVSGL